MKKIFTYPQNSGTNYTDPDYYGNATSGALGRWTDIVDGSYRTHENPVTPTSLGTTGGELLQATAEFYDYYQDKAGASPLTRYDIWENPIFRCNVGQYSEFGFNLRSWAVDRPEREALFARIDDQPTDFPEGYNAFTYFIDGQPYPAYQFGSFNAQHVWVSQNPGDQFFKLYRNATFDAQGNITNLTDVVKNRDVARWEESFRPANEFEVYDTYPILVRDTKLEGEERLSWQNTLAAATTYMTGDLTNGNVSAQQVLQLSNYQQLSSHIDKSTWWDDTANEVMYRYVYDPEFYAISDKAWRVAINGARLVFGGFGSGALPTNPLTYEYTVSGDFEEPAVFHKVGHGLLNGDPINIRSIDGYKITTMAGAELVSGGCGHVWFVDRIDDDSFKLTILPYNSRTPDSYATIVYEPANSYFWGDEYALPIGTGTPNLVDIRIPTKQPLLTQLRCPVWDAQRFDYDGVNLDYNPANHIWYRDPANYTTNNGDLIDNAFALGSSSREPRPYRVLDVELVHAGNKKFTYQDINNVTQPGAIVNNSLMYASGRPARLAQRVKAANQVENHTAVEEFPTFSVTTDSNGYVTGITLLSQGWIGWAYDGGVDRDQGYGNTNADVMFNIQSQPDLYVPVENPLLEADTWDTADYWTSEDYSADRVWPSHVRPRSVGITVVQPNSINRSQSGIKYVRNSGVVKYQLEIEYPPLTQEQFAPFLAAVQGARGQFRPFLFPLRYLADECEYGILFQNPSLPNESRRNLRYSVDGNVGDKVITLEGYGSNEPAVKAGQHIILDQISNSNKRGNRNGGLYTVLHDQESNVFGECKFRVAYPLADSHTAGTQVEEQPAYAIVSLGDNNFEYATDYQGFYSVKVILDLDEFK